MSCRVRVASPLRSYTDGAATVTAGGATVAELLAMPVRPGDTPHLICALSGG